MIRAMGLAAVVVLALVLSACRGGGPEPSVTPLETSSAPSSASSAPSSVTPSMSSATPDQAALLREAERVFRAYQSEVDKIEEAGGIDDDLPATLDRYVLEPYRGSLREAYIEFRKLKVRTTGSANLRLTFSNSDEDPSGSALVSLRVCSDASRVTVHLPDGKTEPGAVAVRTIQFKRDADGVLKIFDGRSKVVKSC